MKMVSTTALEPVLEASETVVEMLTVSGRKARATAPLTGAPPALNIAAQSGRRLRLPSRK